MNKIVVGVDSSPGSTAALEFAGQEARVHDARLDVVLAWEFPAPGDGYYWPTPAELESESTARIEKVMAGFDTAGLDVVSRCVEGPAAPVLLDASKNADLLVVGSRGHGAFVGMLLGSVSLHVVTHAHCPVAVVPLSTD